MIVLQWFCIRLTKVSEKRVVDYEIESISVIDGHASAKGKGIQATYQWYSIQYWILPCSGWWNDFVVFNKDGKSKFKKVTKEVLGVV